VKITKITLVASTALTLSMGSAFADGNDAYIAQYGAGNNALIQQPGNNNDAGKSSAKLTQITSPWGDGNDLDIMQSGNGNEIGMSGFVQTSGNQNSNKADITQSSNNNKVGRVLQTTGGFGGGFQSGNDLTILQEGGNNNAVNEVYQTRIGKYGNIADVTMTGAGGRNTIDVISQYTQGNSGENRITATISGRNNGNGFLSGNAWTSGAGSNDLIQGKLSFSAQGENSIDLQISGDRNQFGVTQYGTKNDVGTLSISGNSNQLGIVQDGISNLVTVADISGNYNNIGIKQLGNDNYTLALVNQNANDVYLEQIGNLNEISYEADGNRNDATITMLGDENFVDAEQRFGNANYMDVEINGSNNNNLSPAMNFTGDALTARNVGDADTGQVFGKGRLWQHGTDNSLILTVSSDSNLFATLQRGDHNAIVGKVSGGSYNMAVVYQNGNGNAANFTQVGSNNNVGILQ
jgi:hypothetical protein